MIRYKLGFASMMYGVLKTDIVFTRALQKLKYSSMKKIIHIHLQCNSDKLLLHDLYNPMISSTTDCDSAKSTVVYYQSMPLITVAEF